MRVCDEVEMDGFACEGWSRPVKGEWKAVNECDGREVGKEGEDECQR